MGASIPIIGFLGLVYIISKLVSKNEGKKETVTAPELDFSKVSDENDNELIAESMRELKSEEFPEELFKSVIENVPDEAWDKYVRISRKGAADTITPSYNLGFFMLGQKALADFGYVNNLRKQKYKGKEIVKGDWVPPLTLDTFQKSPSLQYDIFVKYSKNHAKAISNRYSNIIGKPISLDGVEHAASLSGLMGVAKRAGLGGLDKWISGDRKDYTTKVFVEANGIF